MPEITLSTSFKYLLKALNLAEIKRRASQVVKCDTRVYHSSIFSEILGSQLVSDAVFAE
jgi:hypothetical protein